ncbi:MAG TPA: fructose-6-phosphate aldolase [Kosmotogaceae bacterium]|nr:MAG: Transaldolase [Thermotogales bacterium 46_20]HAA85274.1 fructose-6-phosphate aldolase [Kosmotogaceae bacterium]
MKIFLDTANLDEVKKGVSYGIIDGVTTNPTLVQKEGSDFQSRVKELCEVVKGPVSAEAVSLKSEEMIAEAKELVKISDHVVVKIPMIPEGVKAVRTLSTMGIKTNVTLVFSAVQALLAAKAGATYVSPFIGRLDDISSTGMALVEEIIEVFSQYDYSTEIIVASVRHPMHVLEAAMLGADIVTLPFSVLEKLFKHPMTDLGLERFLEDWKKYQAAQKH